MVAIVTLPSLVISMAWNEFSMGVRFAGVIAGLSMLGLGLSRIPAHGSLQANEALVITALIFVFVPLAMAFPMMGRDVSFLDAFFEATSAITTTGLSTLTTVEDRSDAFLFARAWMQWYGGLGIVVLSLALLIGPGTAARRLAKYSVEWKDLVAGTRKYARRVLEVYLVMTVVGITALLLLGVDWYPALLHVLAGVSTGGFSNYDNSMEGLGSWSAQAVLMILSLAGAISLALYHPAYYRSWRELAGRLEVKGLVTAALLAGLSLAACMTIVGHTPWMEAIRNAPLVAISAQTGAGFTSTDIGSLDPASKLVLIVSMFVGGGTGSTSGGIKILRLLILFRLMQLLIQRTCMPSHAVVEPRLGGQRIEDREIEHALLVIMLFLLVIVLSWFPFLAFGYPPLDALFEIVSATATVGLSSGVTGPELHPFLKWVLCLDMLLGRLEVVALVLVLYPRTWFGKRMV
ncbi:MAG: TrkH family potassium uptake protein [Gammaproteobacteria bacterium]|nr:TrkH family potassium uptake protein [Gammaproteobacteria bacterium]